MSLVNTSWYQKSSDLKLHHILFWLSYFIFWTIFFHTELSLKASLVNSFITISIHGVASYFNIYILFNKLLLQKLYFSYIVAVLLTVILAGLMWMMTIYSVNFNYFGNLRNPWEQKYFLPMMLSVSYTLAITLSLKLVKQWYERERVTQNLERINMETELKYLKSQINPHFLFNSLNSLYALTLTKSDKAPELVLKLSDILRYVLYDGGERWVSLEKEISYLRNYLDLEQIRNGERLKISFDINGNVGGKQVAPMLFLTFLENSFKHGIQQKTSSGYVNVKMDVDEQNLHFQIQNSKPPKTSIAPKNEPGGIGLTNIRKRLDLLYPNKHILKIEDNEQEYSVDLRLQLDAAA
ncbi:MAG: histidine kinase [Bacteroidetes bacterium]|nr:histidine kinase [Bacteroidota bacterium]